MVGLLSGALILLFFSFGCSSRLDDPPGDTGTTDDHGNDRDERHPGRTSGMQVAGNIETGDDEDYFSIQLAGAGILTAATTGNTDTVGHLYDSDGNELAADNDTCW